jgi:hypothetical protein
MRCKNAAHERKNHVPMRDAKAPYKGACEGSRERRESTLQGARKAPPGVPCERQRSDRKQAQTACVAAAASGLR